VDLIERAFAWEALDSRGTPTVACAVVLESGAEGEATVPSGASTGTHEAHERRDGGERYGGKGVRDAVAGFRTELAPLLVGRDVRDLAAIDAALRELDGTPNLERLGANAVLAASVACAVAAAASRGVPLWRAIGPDGPPVLPLPMVNVVSGGAHAGGLVDVQDLLVVPVGARTFAQAIEWASRVRAGTAEAFRARGHDPSLVADEGGLAARLASNRAALDLLLEGIERSGLTPGTEAAIAIDVAATQLLSDGAYVLASEGRTVTAAELVDELASWVDAYPIVSIEDVVGEDDREGWRRATTHLADRVQLLGDDLFVTSPERLAAGIADGIANAVLVKPNQIGTLTTTREVVGRVRDRPLGPLGRDGGQLARGPRGRLAHGPDQGRLDDPIRADGEVESTAANRGRDRRRRARALPLPAVSEPGHHSVGSCCGSSQPDGSLRSRRATH
jgi:enolase